PLAAQPSGAVGGGFAQLASGLSVRPLPGVGNAHPVVPPQTHATPVVEHLSGSGMGLEVLTGPDSGTAIALDGAGNSYVTGSLWNGSDTDLFVAKVDPTGTILFVNVLANPGPDSGHGIALDAQGNAFVTGSMTTPGGTVNAFVAKFDADGNLLGVTLIDGAGPDGGNGIAVRADGSGYVTGSFWNGIDSDFFIARFDPDGNILCTFAYPNPGTDSGNAVA